MSLKDALAGIKQAQTEPESPSAALKERAPAAKRNAKPVEAPGAMPARVTGKSSNPDFESAKLYIRKQTRRTAERKWEDETGGDLSELVEYLLGKYLSS